MTNPTDAEVDKALRAHLAALSPVWTTKLPGVAFRPSAGAPHQICTWMPGQPMPVAMGSGLYHRQAGVFQIDLYFPKTEQRVDLLYARAEAVRAHFYPANGQGLAITAGGGQVLIDRRPSISALDESDAAHNRLVLSVAARIELPPQT